MFHVGKNQTRLKPRKTFQSKKKKKKKITGEIWGDTHIGRSYKPIILMFRWEEHNLISILKKIKRNQKAKRKTDWGDKFIIRIRKTWRSIFFFFCFIEGYQTSNLCALFLIYMEIIILIFIGQDMIMLRSSYGLVECESPFCQRISIQ